MLHSPESYRNWMYLVKSPLPQALHRWTGGDDTYSFDAGNWTQTLLLLPLQRQIVHPRIWKMSNTVPTCLLIQHASSWNSTPKLQSVDIPGWESLGYMPVLQLQRMLRGWVPASVWGGRTNNVKSLSEWKCQLITSMRS